MMDKYADQSARRNATYLIGEEKRFDRMIKNILVDRNIDSHIKRIRKKFRQANPAVKFDRIKTHYGTGYSWNPKSVSV